MLPQESTETMTKTYEYRFVAFPSKLLKHLQPKAHYLFYYEEVYTHKIMKNKAFHLVPLHGNIEAIFFSGYHELCGKILISKGILH